jgi:hypothetical protein
MALNVSRHAHLLCSSLAKSGGFMVAFARGAKSKTGCVPADRAMGDRFVPGMAVAEGHREKMWKNSARAP